MNEIPHGAATLRRSWSVGRLLKWYSFKSNLIEMPGAIEGDSAIDWRWNTLGDMFVVLVANVHVGPNVVAALTSRPNVAVYRPTLMERV